MSYSSCCGVSFDGYNLYENFIDAVYHCREKIFWINTNAKMYSPKRIHHRVHKLTERGWAEIDRSSKSADRDLKLDIILDDNNIDFIREYSKPPTELHKDFNESDYDIFNI